jgi:hypothetical protein
VKPFAESRVRVARKTRLRGVNGTTSTPALSSHVSSDARGFAATVKQHDRGLKV